jgi:hypothetical protein
MEINIEHRRDLQAIARKCPRLRFLAGHLFACGQRSIYEFILAIAAGADLREELERFARLPPEIFRQIGADAMPPTARIVGGGR